MVHELSKKGVYFLLDLPFGAMVLEARQKGEERVRFRGGLNSPGSVTDGQVMHLSNL